MRVVDPPSGFVPAGGAVAGAGDDPPTVGPLAPGRPRPGTPATALVNPRYLARARRVHVAASVVVILVGALVLTGWLLDLPALKGFYAGITMKANASMAFLLAGASLFLLAVSGHHRGARPAGQACALLAGAIGAATLSQHLFGWDLGIDQLLATEGPGALATASPGRMGPPASTSFLLAGASLLLLHARRSVRLAQAAAAGIGLAALLALTGYAYGVEMLYGVGLLAASADRGPAAILVGDGVGSLMARRLLAFAVAIPLLLGWVRLQLETAGYLETRFAVAALVLTIIVLLAALIVHTALLLNDVERQQQAAEAALRDRLHEIETIMEAAPIGLFIATDGTAEHITGNRAARELLRVPTQQDERSLTIATDHRPRHFRVLRDGAEVPGTDLPLRRAAREGAATHDQELDVVFEDGTVAHLLTTALPLLDEDGRPRGSVASVMDITSRRAAEREREELLARERAARAEAEAANRAKDEFLATISHELRTPLNAILGWASMLREMSFTTEPRILSGLATIERNCIAQAQLIDDLLDVSRIVVGDLRLEIGSVDLVGVVGAAVDVVRPAAEARGIELRLSLHGGPCMVSGDAARLQQVMWNLLANAVRFSAPSGTVEVRFATEQGDVTVTVTDTGDGIDPEFLPHVFERFRQAERGANRRGGGLGLGLAIARHIVEMHGGTITAHSEGIGRGARFTVRLPLLGKPREAPVL